MAGVLTRSDTLPQFLGRVGASARANWQIGSQCSNTKSSSTCQWNGMQPPGILGTWLSHRVTSASVHIRVGVYVEPSLRIAAYCKPLACSHTPVVLPPPRPLGPSQPLLLVASSEAPRWYGRTWLFLMSDEPWVAFDVASARIHHMTASIMKRGVGSKKEAPAK
ncbi:hypothetical protein HDK77DRAFT_453744 [Phyllosticta capitalensis]